MTFTQIIDDAGGFTSSDMVYLARNGDKLYATLVGQVTSPPGANVSFVGTETFTGGTGRFAGVSGSSEFTGTAVLDEVGGGTGRYSSLGTIRY